MFFSAVIDRQIKRARFDPQLKQTGLMQPKQEQRLAEQGKVARAEIELRVSEMMRC